MQICIVHQIRTRLKYVGYRHKKTVAADLKRIYTSSDRDATKHEL